MEFHQGILASEKPEYVGYSEALFCGDTLAVFIEL